uniref:RNA-binding protein 42-like n=1 Tax=Heterorhabditis bacteriophora TaxID=37862 RepID=A0A1I7WP76_HETBA
MKRMEVCARRTAPAITPGSQLFRGAPPATPIAQTLPAAISAAQPLTQTAQSDLNHMLHQYQTVAAATNPSAAAATQYFYQPLAATLLPYNLPGTSAFASGSRQPQYVSFAPPAQSLMPQFVPVSIMDPAVLAQAQCFFYYSVLFYNKLNILGFSFVEETTWAQPNVAALTAQMAASTRAHRTNLAKQTIILKRGSLSGVSDATIARRAAAKAKGVVPSPAVSVITISSSEDDDSNGNKAWSVHFDVLIYAMFLKISKPTHCFISWFSNYNLVGLGRRVFCCIYIYIYICILITLAFDILLYCLLRQMKVTNQ